MTTKPAGKRTVKGKETGQPAQRGAPVAVPPKPSSGKRLSATELQALQRYIEAREAGRDPVSDDRMAAVNLLPSYEKETRHRGPNRRDERPVSDKRAMRGLAMAAAVNARLKTQNKTAAFAAVAEEFHISTDTVRREWLAHGESMQRFADAVSEDTHKFQAALRPYLLAASRAWEKALRDNKQRLAKATTKKA